MDPTNINATVYYSRTNPKRDLRAHLAADIPDNCTLLGISYVSVSQNLAVATFELGQCSGTATTRVRREADTFIKLGSDYGPDHQTDVKLIYLNDEWKELIRCSQYKEDET